MPGRSGALTSALHMKSNCSLVHSMRAYGHSEDIREVFRYPLGSGSSCVRVPIGFPSRATWASDARSSSSLSFFFFMDCNAWM